MPNGQLAQLANLRPFEKGASGNPNGRPKGFTATTEYQKALSQTSTDDLLIISQDKSAPPNKRFAAFQLLVIAGEEDKARLAERLTYAEAFIDRTEGKAIQVTKVEHSVGDERPVVLDKDKWDKTKQITSAPILIESDSEDEVKLPPNTFPSAHITKDGNAVEGRSAPAHTDENT